MSPLHHEAVIAMAPERFASVLSPGEYEALLGLVDQAARELHGRVIWNVNSTAKGGGVVEMLRPLLGYCRGAGVDARWVVISGQPDFFAVTKRIHNRLHGFAGDGGPLGDAEREV
jgi:trehalose synthase